MVIIDDLGLNIIAEAINNGIHYVSITVQLHLLHITTEHVVVLLDIVGDLELLRHSHRIFAADLRHGAHAIHTEAADSAMLVRPAHCIVIIAVPDQRPGTEKIWFTIIFQLLALVDTEAEILEGNLFLLQYRTLLFL